jgi:hypothetical protein
MVSRIVHISSFILSTATGWANTEFRSYELFDGPDNNLLLETSESKLKRGLSLCGQTAEEQQLLRRETLKTWLKWGIISG